MKGGVESSPIHTHNFFGPHSNLPRDQLSTCSEKSCITSQICLTGRFLSPSSTPWLRHPHLQNHRARAQYDDKNEGSRRSRPVSGHALYVNVEKRLYHDWLEPLTSVDPRFSIMAVVDRPKMLSSRRDRCSELGIHKCICRGNWRGKSEWYVSNRQSEDNTDGRGGGREVGGTRQSSPQ